MLTSQGPFDEPTGLATDIENKLHEACRTIEYTWRSEFLEVIYYSRLIAPKIEQAFKDRNLVYDLQTVKSTALGEGFEQCAMTWKSMLSAYL